MFDHLYTASEIERDIEAGMRYEFEGVACHVFPVQVPGTVGLLQAVNSFTHDHFYTTSKTDLLFATHQRGYRFEGVACFVFEDPAPNTVPLMALYNPSTGDDFYTTSWSEAVSASTASGYNNQGLLVGSLSNRNPVLSHSSASSRRSIAPFSPT